MHVRLLGERKKDIICVVGLGMMIINQWRLEIVVYIALWLPLHVLFVSFLYYYFFFHSCHQFSLEINKYQCGLAVVINAADSI